MSHALTPVAEHKQPSQRKQTDASNRQKKMCIRDSIVVDNEAGMEHISRGILPMMEVAILVSDCSRRGVQAAGRIAKLMKELNFKPQKTGLIVNRVPDGKLDAGTLEEIRNQGLELLGVVRCV